MSHKGFPVAATGHTVNTGMRKHITSEGTKHKLPQGFGYSFQSRGKAGTSAPLSLPQLSTAYKMVMKTPCTRGAGSPQQRKWGHLKAKENTTWIRTKETKRQSSQGGKTNTQIQLTFSFKSTQLSFPVTAIPYLRSMEGTAIGQCCPLLFTFRTLTLFFLNFFFSSKSPFSFLILIPLG